MSKKIFDEGMTLRGIELVLEHLQDCTQSRALYEELLALGFTPQETLRLWKQWWDRNSTRLRQMMKNEARRKLEPVFHVHQANPKYQGFFVRPLDGSEAKVMTSVDEILSIFDHLPIDLVKNEKEYVTQAVSSTLNGLIIAPLLMDQTLKTVHFDKIFYESFQ